MAELAPEEIEALIERSQPLPPEFVAPPQMQFVTGRPPPVMDAPPVPLPLGTERRFFAQPPAPVNPLEDIRKQINAVQFKTAQDALDAATHFQALRAYQRDLEAGKDPTRWLPLLFKKNPSAAASFATATRPAFTPRPLPGATNIYQVGPRGERLWSPPASTLPQPPLSTDVTEYTIPGTTNVFARSIPSGTRTRRFFEADTGGLTASANISRLNGLIRATEKQMTGIPTTLAGVTMDESIADKDDRVAERKKRFDAMQAERASLEAKVDAWRAQLEGMGQRGSGSPTPEPSGTNAPAASSARPSTNAPAASNPKDPVLEEANEALRKRPDKRAEILKRLKEMGYDVK